jgi:hypothetical protein
MPSLADLAPYFLLGPLLGLASYVLVMETSSRGQLGERFSLMSRKLTLLTQPLAWTAYAIVLLLYLYRASSSEAGLAIAVRIGTAYSVIAFLACLGMTYQVSRTTPALEKKPSMLTRNLILQILPFTAVVCGMVASVLVLDLVTQPPIAPAQPSALDRAML